MSASKHKMSEAVRGAGCCCLAHTSQEAATVKTVRHVSVGFYIHEKSDECICELNDWITLPMSRYNKRPANLYLELSYTFRRAQPISTEPLLHRIEPGQASLTA